MTKHICAYTTMINLCPLKKSIPIWTCSKSFANFFRSKIDRLQQFSFDEKNVLLISQVRLIMEYYFPLFLHGGTESLDLYHPPAPLRSTSFLLSLFRDQPLNHVFQAAHDSLVFLSGQHIYLVLHTALDMPPHLFCGVSEH